MPKVYSPADEELYKQAKSIVHSLHPHLNKVTIEFLFVASDSDPVLTAHGAQVYAITRIVTAKGRAVGRGDVEVVLDSDMWALFTTAQQNALLDHEFSRILAVTKNGERQFDSQGRPKVKLRPPDFVVSWFHAVAQRHGKDSIEVRQAHTLARNYGQLYFPELMVDADAPALPAKVPEPCEGEPVSEGAL